MSLNLQIKPLENLENLVPQKCIISKTKFPDDQKPGDWCKCRISDDSFSVCQVFPRDTISPSVCYMDAVVSKYFDDAMSMGLRTELTKLETLKLNTNTECLELELTFVITEKLFSKNSLQKITIEHLICTAQHYLQSLYLVVGSQVQLEDLQQLGIAAINIDDIVVGTDKTKAISTAVFSINDDTKLLARDVQLLTTHDKPTFYTHGFEQAQQGLQDLLQVVKMQRNCNWLVRPSLNALLVGSIGCGKTTLAQWFFHEHNCNVFSIAASNVLGQYPGETEAALRLKFQSVMTFVKQLRPKFPTVVLIEELHLLCPVNTISNNDACNSLRICAQLINLIDEMHLTRANVMCLATTSAPETLNELVRRPGRFEREIFIAAPTAQQRLRLFRALFNDSFYARELDEQLTDHLLETVAKQTQGFMITDLALLIRSVGQYLLRDRRSSLATVLKQALRKSKPTSMRGTDVTVFKPDQRFDSVGGMLQLKRTLELSVLAGLQHQAAFQRFGLDLPKGVLLYGPPGCAKTTIAKCLATEANMTFIATSGAEVYSPYIGCAEKFIAKIFDTARKHAPCLIFLDEIDSLVGRRGSDSKGEIQIRILSTLLTEMDGIVSNTKCSTDGLSHILVVAATNRPDMIDDALMRPGRFDKLIHVPAPDLESRRAIIDLFAQRMPFAPDVDLNAIAANTENYSGADLCNLCNEAALNALNCDFDVACIGMKDFEIILGEQKSSLTQAQIQWYIDFENKFVR